MDKTNRSASWIEEGYKLYAQDGMEGLHVERLARLLQLNKSGFYHYFGDHEGYCEALLRMHVQKANAFLADAKECKDIDPGYLMVLVKHTLPVMFQVQLTRDKSKHSFYKLSQSIDDKVNIAIAGKWGEFLGVHGNPDLATKYFSFIRDAFYTRVSFQNLNFEFLHNLVTEAKTLLEQATVKAHTSDATAILPR